LVLDDQQISAMLDDATGVDADEEIDATDLLVLPGFVDPDAPGGASSTRAAGDQRAAAAGGTTTMITILDTNASAADTQTDQVADIAHWYPVDGGALPTAEQLSRMAQTGIAGCV